MKTNVELLSSMVFLDSQNTFNESIAKDMNYIYQLPVINQFDNKSNSKTKWIKTKKNWKLKKWLILQDSYISFCSLAINKVILSPATNHRNSANLISSFAWLPYSPNLKPCNFLCGWIKFIHSINRSNLLI